MMKHPFTSNKALALAAIGLLTLQSLSAQTPASPPPPGPSAVPNTPPPNDLPPPPPPRRGGPMANLSREERMQLRVAHDKAIQLDPTLKTKMDEAVKSMHDAMLKVDPSLAPILEKITPKKWAKEFSPSCQKNPASTNTAAVPSSESRMACNPAASNSMAEGGHFREGHGNPAGFENLTPAEQQQVKALYGKVKSDPSVIAAKLAMKSATTPEARHAAKESLHQAMHAAMLKEDPSIAPVLEKLHPTKPTL